MQKVLVSLVLLLTVAGAATAQVDYQPYSYQFYQKLNDAVYSTGTRVHSSLKPFFIDDSLLKHTYDSLMNVNNDGKPHSGLYQKLFNEHLIDSKNSTST